MCTILEQRKEESHFPRIDMCYILTDSTFSRDPVAPDCTEILYILALIVAFPLSHK